MRHLFTQRSGTGLFPMDVATADQFVPDRCPHPRFKCLLVPEWLELPESLYRSLLRLHGCHVVVQHLGSCPTRDGLDVWPGDVLPDRICREGPAKYMASVLQGYPRSFGQTIYILPDSVITQSRSFFAHPQPVEGVRALVQVTEHRSLTPAVEGNLPLPSGPCRGSPGSSIGPSPGLPSSTSTFHSF